MLRLDGGPSPKGLSSIASQPGTLTIPVPDGDPVIITQHEPSEAIKVVVL
jgi:hypothetical protein